MRENNYNRSSDYDDRRRRDNGSSNDLLRKEQLYRHSLQDRYFKSDVISLRIGQFCGFIYNLTLLYFVYYLVKVGNKDLAIKVFAINAALVFLVVLVSKIERRIFLRNRRGRGSRGRRPSSRRGGSYSRNSK